MPSATTMKPMSAAFQSPNVAISHCASGASTTVPSEPVAATKPMRWMRLWGGVALATTPISTPKPVPATPMPIRKPAMSRPTPPRDAIIRRRPSA
jgi:hypothetical protein